MSLNHLIILISFYTGLKAYVQAGRYQTEDEAREVDSDVKIMLQHNKIPYININAQEGVSIEMAHHVRTALGLS